MFMCCSRFIRPTSVVVITTVFESVNLSSNLRWVLSTFEKGGAKPFKGTNGSLSPCGEMDIASDF